MTECAGPQGSGSRTDLQELGDPQALEEQVPEKTPVHKNVAAYGRRLTPNSGWALVPAAREFRR